MKVRELVGQWVTLGTSLWLFCEPGPGTMLPSALPGKLYRSGTERFAFRTPQGACHFLEVRGFAMESNVVPGGIVYGPEPPPGPFGKPGIPMFKLVPGAVDGWPPNVPHETVHAPPTPPAKKAPAS